MRDFSSAKGNEPINKIKAMAVKLRKENPKIKHGHALHIVSVALGFRDWNVLSALLKTDPQRIEKLIEGKE